jgi:tetraacyldisaccharide 4'-kinase
VKYFRWILVPFSLIFGLVASWRRTAFTLGLLKRKRGVLPAVVVGNITVGGTGKTPFILWLQKKLEHKKPAILSRGYGRKSKGFIQLHEDISVTMVGDEPMEIFRASGAKLPTFVCEDRLSGIEGIKTAAPGTGVVLLDDGFQHLKLLPDFSILLCHYQNPFFKDWPIPFGRLREFAFNARYCDAIVVTKCPENMGMEDGLGWFEALARYGKPIFFARYNNSIPVNKNAETLANGEAVVLVSALANNEAFENWAKSKYEVVDQFSYRDHFSFGIADAQRWQDAMVAGNARGILLTRKDMVKAGELAPELPIYATHTEVEILFDSEEDLIALILTKIER